jgi:cyclopropane fatty-acyl-phospholipid synthase-like methyltransferase
MEQLQKVKEYYKECDKSYQHWGAEEIYNIHYGFWDKNTKSHVQSLENMNRALAEKLKIKPGDKILDAGCGVGASAIWLVKNYNVEVMGITISELQCEKANNFAKKEGLSERVKFYVRDFQNPGFENGSFNIVWILESLCHGEDKGKFIQEAYRILKNQGKLIVADFFLAKPYTKLSKIEKWLIDHWLKGWSLAGLWTAEEFKNYAEKTGFKNIEITDITKNTSPSAKEIKKRTLVQMAHVASCIYQGLVLKLGAWKYQIIYGEKG